MKNKFIIYLFVFLACTGCSEDEEEFFSGTDNSIDYPQIESNEIVNEKLFEVINLNYPGLEKVKKYYESNQYYFAAKALLDYYRLRTEVINPELSLINITLASDDQKIADQALEYRFYVKNYYENKDEKLSYSFLKDGKIDWTINPPKANEFRSQIHRHQWMVPQAKVYRTTQDEKYIKSWIEVYKDWLKQNPRPETMSGEEPVSWGALQVAERVTSQIKLMSYYMNSVNFTPEWLSTFLVNFAEQVEHIQRNWYSGGNNILISQAHAVTVAAILFPEFKNAEQWLNTGTEVLGREIEPQFLPDGMQYELDLSYHIGEIATFNSAMVIAQANNKSDKFPATYTESLRNATEIVRHMMYPNYSVPGFNDTRPVSYTKNVLTRNLKMYAEMFPDNEAMKWVAYEGKQGTEPTELIKKFPDAGYYILRNGWKQSSTMLIHSNNTSEHWHSHPDNGTFELYHKGRNFFPDSGVYTYGGDEAANAEREWFRSTKVHNTMTLDKKTITTTEGKFLKLSTENNIDILVTENQGYNNLKHRRAIFYVNKQIENKQFFVIVDEGIGNASGTINLNFNLCEGKDNEVVLDLNQQGAHTAFADNNNLLIRTFGNTALTSHEFEGKVSYAVDKYTPRKAYSVDMNKTAEQTARYITVLLPVEGTTDATTISASFTDIGYHENGASITVEINGTKYDLNYAL